MKKPRVLLLILPYIILISFFIGAYSDFSRKVSDQKHDMVQQLALTKSSINEVTNHNISKMVGIATHIGINTNIDIAELNYFVMQVVPSQNNIISNLGIFQDTTAIYLYPYEPNKVMQNINLVDIPSQKDDALYVKNNLEVVLTPPVETVQGGIGIMTRLPIILPNGSYWGQLGYMMALDDIIEKLLLDTDKYAFLISQYDNENNFMHTIYDTGFEERFLVDEIIVKIPSGYWVVKIEYNNLLNLTSLAFFIMLFSAVIFFGISKYIIKKFNDSEKQLNSIMNSINTFIFVINSNGSFISVNKSMLKSFDLSEHEIIGKSYFDDSLNNLLGFIQFDSFINSGLNEIYTSSDVSYIDKNGVEKWVYITLQRINKKIFGEPVIIGTSVDITKEKTLQETVNHEKKMSAVGRIVGGLAHDFNNNLLQIQSAKELLVIHNQSFTDKSLKYLNIIQTASDKLSMLTSKLLSYSRRGSWIKSKVDIHNLIVEIINNNSLNTGDITIHHDLNAVSYSIIGDLKELDNALYSIILNSVESITNSGLINIITSNIDIENEIKINKFFTLSPGKHIMLIIEDDGCGISDDIIDNIFEPFFTTKGIGKGLGLSVVLGIISDLNGSVEVKSQEGFNTTVIIKLPLN